MRGATSISFTEGFKRDYSKLPPNIRELADGCMKDILQDPIPGARRAHSVTPRGHKPTVYTVDVTANKAYKLSFHIEGCTAILRRVDTHKAIDRRA